MKKILTLIIVLLFPTTEAIALDQWDSEIGVTGVEANGEQIYIHVTPNPHNCLYSGIYFNSPTVMDKALSIALSAKMSGKKVRLVYDQPGGNGAKCIGNSIYVQ